MQRLFTDTRELDKSCREHFCLTEELMMENAAAGLERHILNIISDSEKSGGNNQKNSVIILCGSGNNGADGYALARRLSGTVNVTAVCVTEPKTELCRLQNRRSLSCGVRIISSDDDSFGSLLKDSAVAVECIFGSGFHGNFDGKVSAVLRAVNDSECVRVACDIPAGISMNGVCCPEPFKADLTVAMGALKLCLYSDCAKDYAGKIVCENLGVSRRLFEESGLKDSVFPAAMLLEESDIVLPYRKKNLVNKGSFGHAVIACGEKVGAACIAGTAALRFGAGLVTLVNGDSEFSRDELPQIPAELMSGTDFPASVSAVAFGMGLGRNTGKADIFFEWLLEHENIPCVVDADCFYEKTLPEFLDKRDCSDTVLTPHPKEFQSLLKLCGLGEYSINECVNERPLLIERFCRRFVGTVLLVKGANPVIGRYDGNKMELFVNPLGNPSLAKAGSGDVLAGLICALLAQGYEPLDAALNASAAHAAASGKIKNNYSLSPFSLIETVASL